jgi:hypothetical protein
LFLILVSQNFCGDHCNNIDLNETSGRGPVLILDPNQISPELRGYYLPPCRNRRRGWGLPRLLSVPSWLFQHLADVEEANNA